MTRPVGRQVIVVVGASSGIGLGCARSFAAEGASVVLAARNREDLEREAERIREGGGRALAVRCDVSRPAEARSLADQAVEAFGRIDTWVQAAAVSLYATFVASDLEDVRRVLEVNVLGAMAGAQAALPHLERTGGALVVIGSGLGDRGVPLQSAYSASKHALKGWLDALRVELRDAGSPVRVTLVKPSSINTPLFDKARTDLGVAPRPIPPVYPVSLAVEAIRKAAEGGHRDLFVGGAARALSYAERISPAGVDRYLAGRSDRAQRTDRRKEPGAPDNLRGPVAHDGGVEGAFGDEVRAPSWWPWAGLAAAALALAVSRQLSRRRTASSARSSRSSPRPVTSTT